MAKNSPFMTTIDTTIASNLQDQCYVNVLMPAGQEYTLQASEMTEKTSLDVRRHTLRNNTSVHARIFDLSNEDSEACKLFLCYISLPEPDDYPALWAFDDEDASEVAKYQYYLVKAWYLGHKYNMKNFQDVMMQFLLEAAEDYLMNIGIAQYAFTRLPEGSPLRQLISEQLALAIQRDKVMQYGDLQPLIGIPTAMKEINQALADLLGDDTAFDSRRTMPKIAEFMVGEEHLSYEYSDDEDEGDESNDEEMRDFIRDSLSDSDTPDLSSSEEEPDSDDAPDIPSEDETDDRDSEQEEDVEDMDSDEEEVEADDEV